MTLSLWDYLAETFGTREKNDDAGKGLGRPKLRIHLCPSETVHKPFNSAFPVFVKWEQCDSLSKWRERQQQEHHQVADAAQMGAAISTEK